MEEVRLLNVKMIINMKNGDKHKIILPDCDINTPIVEFLQKKMFLNYKKENNLNISCFSLDNEEKTAIAIILDDISSIEYGFKAVE